MKPVEGLRIERRNSTLELQHRHGRWVARKRYHNQYSVESELAAYARLRALAARLPELRVPDCRRSSKDAELLEIEWLEGPTLRELLMGGQPGLTPRIETLICQLLVACNQAEGNFDIEPGNLIVLPQQLGVIDPTMLPLSIPHQEPAGFMLGLLKIGLARSWSPAVWTRTHHVGQRIARAYCRSANIQPDDLRRSIGAYLRVVIHWNRQQAAGERLRLRLARRLVLIPLYRTIARLCER